MATLPRFPLPRWTRRGACGLAGAVSLYALAGFLVLPAVLRTQLPRRLERALGRKVQLARVRTNPFTLSITLDGLRIQDRDGQPLAGWNRLYADLDLSTLFGRSLSLETLNLAEPYGRLVLDPRGRLNIADLLDHPSGSPQAPGAPLDLRIAHLKIQGARLALLDLSASQPFSTTLGPVNLALENLRTTAGQTSRISLAAATEAGERFALEGGLDLAAMTARGQLRLDRIQVAKYRPYYQALLNLEPRSGSLDLAASCRLDWAPGHAGFRIQEGTLALTGLKLTEKGRKAPLLDLQRLDASGIEADPLGRSLLIGSLRLRGADLTVLRSREGALNLRAFIPPEQKPLEPPQPFRFHLGELVLSESRATLTDLFPSRPVAAKVSDLALTLKGLDLDPASVSDLALSFTANGAARMTAEGRVRLQVPSGDLAVRVQGLDLAPFDAYLPDTLDVRVNTGLLSLEGHARFDSPSGPFAYSGQARVQRLEVMDGARQEPFLRYQDLSLRGLRAGTHPQELRLEEAELIAPEYRMVVAKDGSSNVARALKLESKGSAPTLGAALPPTLGPAFRVDLRRIRMRQGRLSFLDRSVEPNAALLLSEIKGTSLGLSTDREGRSQVDFSGKAGAFGTLQVQGRTMPLRHDMDTDVTARITGADLTDFSPYAAKYLGYTIREGKLDMSSRVRIRDRQLQVEDQTRLDHFYLGESVPSPEATHLPVKLGLALLRDRKGIITVDVPVDGSLDDPGFHYGRMVWKAILNTLGKVATSPFTLISSLFGGGADLSTVRFRPGTDLLEASEAGKLDKLATALRERPDLHLELEGAVDPAGDGAALARARLETLLLQTLQSSRKLGGLAPGTPLTPEERREAIQAAFQKAFPTPKGPLPVPPPPLAEQELRLIGTLGATPQDLRELAQARTRAAMAQLLKDHQIEASRLFTVEASSAAATAGSRVSFTLK